MSCGLLLRHSVKLLGKFSSELIKYFLRTQKSTYGLIYFKYNGVSMVLISIITIKY